MGILPYKYMLKGKFRFDLEAVEGLFKPKSPPLLGADISSSAIKMVEIAEAGKGMYRVERYAIEPLPNKALVRDLVTEIAPPDERL